MKIIDLLNKIANGEGVPNKIKWEDIIYVYSEIDKDYLEYPFSDEEYKGLFDMRDSILTQFLNDEVKIIEDDEEDNKIEKINEILRIDDLKPPYDENLKMIWKNVIIQQNKINEIIDKLNEMEENK